MSRLIIALLCTATGACSGGGSEPSDDGGSPDDASPDTGADASPPSCEPAPPEPPGEDFFRDISDSSGIQEDNFVDASEGLPINDHSRLAFADLNGDALDDIVMHNLFPNPLAGFPFEHLVFLNNGDGTFQHFSDESGLRDVQAGFFAFGDVDNDGDNDVFAGLDTPELSGETHTLLLNDGDAHFTEMSGSGLEGTEGETVAANAVFADFDGDGNLDLFVGNGHTSFAAPDQLFMGNGDGTFDEASDQLDGNAARPTNGSVACDYDNDGDMDIVASVYGISRGGAPNFLWENDGSGGFTDVAAERGVARQPTGNYFLEETDMGTAEEPMGAPYVGGNGFGIDCTDVDRDGRLDLLMTAISHPTLGDYGRTWSDPTLLLHNGGPESDWSFDNVFLERGLPFNEGDVDGALVDFDNDGRVDISLSREDKYEAAYSEPEHKGWFGLMRQTADGSFEDLSLASGINEMGSEHSRMKGAQNHAWSDIEHDGDLDLLVGGRVDGATGRPNLLFENQIGSERAWLGVRLMASADAPINRDAIGARATLSVEGSDEVLVRELRASRGMHNSADSRLLSFGLGSVPDCAFTLTVRWPDGTEASWSSEQTGRNQYVTITYPDTLAEGI